MLSAINNKQQTTNNKYAIGTNFGNYTITQGTVKYKSFDAFYNKKQTDETINKNLSEKIASLGIEEMKALISETKNTSNNISTSTNISKGLRNALWDNMKWYQYLFTIFFGNNESIKTALLNLEDTIVDSMFQKIKNKANILGSLSKDTTADECKQALEDIKAFTNFLLKKEQRLSEKSQTKLLTKIIPNMCIEVRQFSIPDGVNISEQKGNKGIEIKGNYTNIENLSDKDIKKLKDNFEQNKVVLECIQKLTDKFYTERSSDTSYLTEVVHKLLLTRNTESIMLAIEICKNHKNQLSQNTIEDIHKIIKNCKFVTSLPRISISYIDTRYISGSFDTLEKIKIDLKKNFPKNQI